MGIFPAAFYAAQPRVLRHTQRKTLSPARFSTLAMSGWSLNMLRSSISACLSPAPINALDPPPSPWGMNLGEKSRSLMDEEPWAPSPGPLPLRKSRFTGDVSTDDTYYTFAKPQDARGIEPHRPLACSTKLCNGKWDSSLEFHHVKYRSGCLATYRWKA